MPSPEQILKSLMDFLKAPTWDRSRQIVYAHQGQINVWVEMIETMLTDPATVLMVYPGRTRSDATAMLKKHRAVLVRCRQVGIAQAFGEVNRQMTRPQPVSRSSASVQISQQPDRRGLIGLFFFVGLVAATVAGVLIYSHVAKPAKLPKAQIPQITHITTYQKGQLVYFRAHYRDWVRLF
jgi:hypothetical protein